MFWTVRPFDTATVVIKTKTNRGHFLMFWAVRLKTGSTGYMGRIEYS